MERLTSKRDWIEAGKDLSNEYGYSHIWRRLKQIEDIIGDTYDLDRLRELVEADKEGRCVVLNGPNCLKCHYMHEDNGNCTAIGGFCTAVPAAHCPLLKELLANEASRK